MHSRSMRLLPTLLVAASLAAPFTAQATNIHIPNPLTGEHPTGLVRAAENLVADLETATSEDWGITTYNDRTPPVSVPSNTGLIVRIDTVPTSDTGYRISVHASGYFILRSPTMEGAIDGLHGVRIRLKMDGYTGSFISGGPVTVEPAFLRRGFMILNPEPDWTAADWIEYVDYHQLLGANVLTVGIPGLYDPDDARTHYLAPAYADLAATMEHCHDVGMKFQITTAANMMSPGFYWDHFEPEHAHYDSDGTTVAVTAETEEYGADSNDGTHEHRALPFPPGASMAKVAAANPLLSTVQADLAAHQANFYETFAEADAFLVAFTEGAADYGPDVISDPETNLVGAHLAWVEDRIADGYAEAGGSDPEPAQLTYFGWLHFLWWSWALSDLDGDGQADDDGANTHPGFGDWSVSTPSIIDSYTDPDPGDTAVRSEWIQETGAFYFDLPVVFGTVAGFHTPPLPESMVDPLGYVADVEVSSSKIFDTTAYLYWCHKETDLRNYFLRPAIRETIAELRIALRKELDVTEWSALTAATGVMGYRPFAPSRRFLNDFVVLRCASDTSLLDLGTDDLIEPNDPDLEGLNSLRDLVVDDMARFLLGGTSHHAYSALKDSITKLDAALPIFAPKSPDDVLASLDDLNDLTSPTLSWWSESSRLTDYYQLLAFTAFVEKAKELADQSQNNDAYVAAALRVARQTRHLFRYVFEGQVRELVDSLLD